MTKKSFQKSTFSHDTDEYIQFNIYEELKNFSNEINFDQKEINLIQMNFKHSKFKLKNFISK